MAKPSTNQKKLLRNWTAVAAIPCPGTKYALATCRDPDVLTRLAVAFPECFRKGDAGETDLFSWKRILRVAAKYRARNVRDTIILALTPYRWLHDLRDANLDPEDADLAAIPILAMWGTTWFGKDVYPPFEMIQQLIAQKDATLKGPLFLEHEGVRCVVGAVWFDNDGCPHEGHTLDEDHIIDSIVELALVPAHVISFDC